MRKIDKASYTIFSEIVLGIVFSLLSLFLFFKIIFEVLTKDIVYIDNLVLNFIYSFRDPFLTQIMHFVSFLGGEFTLLLTAVIVVIFAFKKHKKEAAFFAFTVFTGYVLNNIIKYSLKIPRPNIDPLSHVGSYGFPSGHAMNSLIFYGLLAYFIFHFTKNRGSSVLVAIFLIIIVLLIGFSRLYLGVHHPSDVIGGFIAGFWWLSTAILIDKTLVFYMLVKHKDK